MQKQINSKAEKQSLNRKCDKNGVNMTKTADYLKK